MNALVFDGTGVRAVERDIPDLAERYVLIRVILAGVCNTDLELIRGYMGFRGTLGHEFVGVVEAGPQEWRGKRVVGEINFACGRCPTCATGLARHCPTRKVMGILDADGAFAEYVVAPAENLHAVPDTISDEEAVFVEPLAAAFEILEQTKIEPGSKAVVLGDGKLGQLVAQVLCAAGAKVTAIGKYPHKLAKIGALGIETRLLEDWRPNGADLVVEATGSSAGFTAAVAAVRPRGTLVLKSTVADRAAFDLTALVINEITLVGSRCGRFGPALAALASRRIQVRPMISADYPLRQGVEALRRASDSDALKVLLRPN